MSLTTSPSSTPQPGTRLIPHGDTSRYINRTHFAFGGPHGSPVDMMWDTQTNQWVPMSVIENSSLDNPYYGKDNPYFQGDTRNGPAIDPMHQQMQDFIKYLRMTPDQLLAQKDPAFTGLQNSTMASAGQMASDRGINGPLSVANAQQMTSNSLGGLYNQRLGLAGQMMNSDANYQLGLDKLDQIDAQYTADRQDASNLANHNNDMAWGSGIGGVLGGIGGALASIPSFGTMAPLLIPAGVSAGAGLGGAIGGSLGGGMPGPSPYPRRRRGGGMGYGGY